MRIRGGTNALIAAIVTGRLDPFDAKHENERGDPRWDRLGGSDKRERLRREHRRDDKRKRRLRDRLGDLCPF